VLLLLTTLTNTMDPNVIKLAMGAAGAGGVDFQLWTWGYNANGQLGQNNLTYYSSPRQVGSLTDWSKISGGFQHCLAVKTNGGLWAWGGNSFGQHGTGNTTGRSSPVQVGALTDWLSASAGYRHSAAVKTDGTLWAWGDNSFGQLGDGTTVNKSSPVQVGALTTWAKVSAGGAASSGFTLAIKTDGTLWAFGRNNFGQLGTGNTTSYSSPIQIGALTTWSSISAHVYNSHAIKTDGTLWGWGQNSSGDLGVGDQTSYSSPKQVGALTNWRSVSKDVTNGASILAVKTDNTAWGWCSNVYGALGIGSSGDSYSSPVQIGALSNWSVIECDGYSSIALKTGGTLWSWGYNYYGQLGAGNKTDRSSPVQVGALTSWQSISAGRFFATAIKKP
jgi:alpha-tubulin suppressor-like RCC1 family protein